MQHTCGECKVSGLLVESADGIPVGPPRHGVALEGHTLTLQRCVVGTFRRLLGTLPGLNALTVAAVVVSVARTFPFQILLPHHRTTGVYRDGVGRPPFSLLLIVASFRSRIGGGSNESGARTAVGLFAVRRGGSFIEVVERLKKMTAHTGLHVSGIIAQRCEVPRHENTHADRLSKEILWDMGVVARPA